MRAWVLLLTVGTALAGCSLMQSEPPTTATAPPARRTRHAMSAPGTGQQLSCSAHPSIDRWQSRLRRDATRLKKVAHQPVAHRVRQMVVEAGLPPSLALIPILESSYRPHVRSHDGGAGLWQLQKPTARRFGLVVTKYNDERLDPDRATRAALRYLRMLHWHYKSWPLALAAYNAGEGRVDRALKARPSSTVWELASAQQIPRRTADYVGRFFAMTRLIEEPGPPC